MCTKDAAHQLHQDQADTPGGQQGLQRTAVEEPDHRALQHHTHQRGRHESDGNGSNQVPVKCTGEVTLEHTLHEVGGIGPNHHQLAVRHVDHTHQPIGDGQAQSHQQQDRAQADTAENHAQAFTPDQRAFDGFERGLNLCLDCSIGLHLQALAQEQLDVRAAAFAEVNSGLQAARLFAAGQECGGTGHFKLNLDLLIGFCGQRFVDDGQARLIGLFQQRLYRCCAHLVVRAGQTERGQRRFQRTPHHVVVDDVFRVVGQPHFGTGHGVVTLVVLDDEHLGTSDADGIVRQRLDKSRRAAIGRLHRQVQRHNTLFGFAHGNRLGLGRRQGVCRCSEPQQRRKDSGKPAVD